ncbi:MAG TPA: dihydrolipoyl dehydrogenase [Thermoanaerobaculia bacterium]|nr:dihydrolipoyl dehydrogenase [Thermoanaerobaculia bacterium]
MPDPRDLVVIGSGPGGYVAAIRAAQLGLAVTVVEKDPFLGGTCLHRGCIPTKALLHTADLLEEARRGAEFGVACAEPKLDLARAHQHKQKVVRKNAKGIEALFRKNHIEVVQGRGRLDGARRVVVEGDGGERGVDTRHVLIATGSAVRALPFLPFDGKRVLSSDHILELASVPARLAILGAGAVGVEFASMFAAFGSKVTLIEMLPRVLPLEDEEISAALEKSLARRGIEILTGTGASGARVAENGVVLELSSRTLEADVVLVAVGRRPVTEELGLEAAGVVLERGFVRVDRFMRTAAPEVYAIGDVVPTQQLAHLASAEGILAVEHIAGLDPRPIDYDQVPSCTYCDPEVASVGLTEAKARERGHHVVTGKFPFVASGKAAILGRSDGFVKVVRETKHDQLLGVHVIGPRATELIAEAGIALRLEATDEDLERAIHPHPTLSEAMMEAARVAAGRGLHI